MAGGSGRIRTGGGLSSRGARVENERLWVDAVISSGGGGVVANVTIVGPLPVPVDVVSSVPIVVSGTVDIGNEPIDVNIVSPLPVPVSDDGGSLTVDFTRPVEVSDNGGSLTVDFTRPVEVSDNGGSLTVDGTVAVGPTVTPGTGAANLGKAEDQLAASGDVGVMALAVRADTPAATAANGDYVPLLTDSLGRLHIGPGTLASSLGKAEDAQHGSGDVGVMALAVRQDTLAALAADGDYIPLTTDSLGRLNVRALLVENAFPLSSSTNGRPISVTSALPTFVTLHTVPASSVDTITIYVSNTGNADNTFVVGLGGTASGQQLSAFIPQGETVVVLAEAVMNAAEVISGSLIAGGSARVFGKVVRRQA